MNTTMNIHDVTDIKVEQSRKLGKSGTWVRDITFYTSTGSINVACFAADLQDVALHFETPDA